MWGEGAPHPPPHIPVNTTPITAQHRAPRSVAHPPSSTSSAGRYFTPRHTRYSRNWYFPYRRLLLQRMMSAALEIAWVKILVCVHVSRYTFAQYIDTSTMVDGYQKAQAESYPCPKIYLYGQTDPPRVTRRRRQVAPRGSLRREKRTFCLQNPGINYGHFAPRILV